MNEMKNFQMGGEEGMDDLAGSLSGLLKGLTESLGVEGVHNRLLRKKEKTSRTCLPESTERKGTSSPSQANCWKSS